MPIGTVKFFDNSKGYGFITNEAGGSDAFVHISAVEAAGMSTLEKEQRLSYDLENDQRGKTSAVNLQSVESEQAPQAIDQSEQAAQPTPAADQAERAL